MASPRCRGLGPQRGTKLRHNGEGPPSLFLARAFSPFGFGSVADRAPSRRFLALTARDGLSRLSGAVFIAHHRAFRLRAARTPRVASWGECGQCRWPLWPWLWLALDLPVGLCAMLCVVCAHVSSVHVRPRGFVGERQL